MFKYRATNWGAFEIEKVEILGETASFYTLVGIQGKHAKRSNNSGYFDTWEEGRSHFLDVTNERIRTARTELQQMLDSYAYIKALVNDQE